MIRVLVGLLFGVFIVIRLILAYIEEVRDEISLHRRQGKDRRNP